MPRANQYALSPTIPGKRRAPPPELNEREAKTWREIVARLPPGWFTSDNSAVLKELCRHVRLSDDLTADIATARAAVDDARRASISTGKLLRDYLVLLRAHALQSERIGTLSTKLRLTNQSREAKAARSQADAASTYPEPWNDWRRNPDDGTPTEQ